MAKLTDKFAIGYLSHVTIKPIKPIKLISTDHPILTFGELGSYTVLIDIKYSLYLTIFSSFFQVNQPTVLWKYTRSAHLRVLSFLC